MLSMFPTLRHCFWGYYKYIHIIYIIYIYIHRSYIYIIYIDVLHGNILRVIWPKQTSADLHGASGVSMAMFKTTVD